MKISDKAQFNKIERAKDTMKDEKKERSGERERKFEKQKMVEE